MLKKVKQKQYKSKKEFKDDLDLIWSNCFTYNATEVRQSSIRAPPAVASPILRTIPSAYALCASNPRLNTSSSISPTGRSAPIPRSYRPLGPIVWPSPFKFVPSSEPVEWH